MSKIKVRGSSNTEYNAEILTTRITLCVTSGSSGEAVTLGKNKLENLLEAMEERLGLKSECFSLERENVDKSYNSKEYTFSKTICIKTDMSLKTAEDITDVLSGFSDIDYSFGYELKDIEAKENEVLARAIKNSRLKAEAIAECTGQAVTGAEEIRYEFPAEVNEQGFDRMCFAAAGSSKMRRADKLSLPKITVSKSVDITWITEKK